MSRLIVVVGVTGIQVGVLSSVTFVLKDTDCVQGSSVANTFLGLSGWKVRGITRNQSSPAAQGLEAKGVEIVKGDLDDKHSLLSAFEGATAVFSNTDFFGHLFSALSSKDLPKGLTPNQYAFKREVEQGVNIAEAAASPTVLKTLERFVLSSLSNATKWSNGKYAHVYHNDAKAEIIEVIQTRFPELAAKMSTVQIGHYVTNWKQSPALTPQKHADGSFVIQRTFSPQFRMPFVVRL